MSRPVDRTRGVMGSARPVGATHRAASLRVRPRVIAAAGLDVMEQQPPDPANPLLQLDNVVLTPHIAAFSDRFWHDYWTHSIRTIIECARTGRPLWTVNPEVTPRLGS